MGSLAIAATTATDNCPGTVTKTASTLGTCSAVVTVRGTDTCGNYAEVTYNTRIETFPSNIIAGNFGFKPEPLFQVTDDKERQAPQVKF